MREKVTKTGKRIGASKRICGEKTKSLPEFTAENESDLAIE
jgi:hypothetical protein